MLADTSPPQGNVFLALTLCWGRQARRPDGVYTALVKQARRVSRPHAQ